MRITLGFESAAKSEAAKRNKGANAVFMNMRIVLTSDFTENTDQEITIIISSVSLWI